MIEDILKQIEEAVILRNYDFQNNVQLPQIQEFSNYFEEHLQRVTAEMADKYKIISEQLLDNGIFINLVEQNIFNTNTRASPKMKEYYYFWERRVYNALTKMILRALLTYKNLIQQPTGRQTPLFQI